MCVCVCVCIYKYTDIIIDGEIFSVGSPYFMFKNDEITDIKVQTPDQTASENIFLYFKNRELKLKDNITPIGGSFVALPYYFVHTGNMHVLHLARLSAFNGRQVADYLQLI